MFGIRLPQLGKKKHEVRLGFETNIRLGFLKSKKHAVKFVHFLNERYDAEAFYEEETNFFGIYIPYTDKNEERKVKFRACLLAVLAVCE